MILKFRRSVWIVLFGTPDMAAHILDALVQHKVDIAAIVTKPDTPQGRSSKLIAPSVKAACPKAYPKRSHFAA